MKGREEKRMSITKTSKILLVVGLVVGVVAGYCVGFFVYQPQISQLESNLSEVQDITASLEADLTESRDAITLLETQLSELLSTFSMQVIPARVDDAVAGQRCVFLVVVTEPEWAKGTAVNISATAFNASVTVNPQAITPGQVAEVTVIPDEMSWETQEIVQDNMTIIVPPEPVILTANVSGKRNGLRQTETITVRVMEGEDGLGPYASEVRDRFVPWLATNHPELGITNETEWTGTIVYPHIYVVSYYLFYSDEWEMGVRWHVTRIPDDWAEIYLRRRFVEMPPSHAFKIDSFKTEPHMEPHVIDPPESLWR